MNSIELLKISVNAAIRSCESNGIDPADNDDAFMRGFAAAHRKLGAFMAGWPEQLDDIADDTLIVALQFCESMIQKDACNSEFWRRLAGSLRKAATIPRK